MLEAQYGLGRYSKDISGEDNQMLSKLVFCHSIIVMVGLSLVKISLAVFLRRFSQTLLGKALVGSIGRFTPQRGNPITDLKHTDKSVFLIAFTIACGLTLILQCIPVAAAWDPSLRPHARCFNNNTFTAIGLWNSSEIARIFLPHLNLFLTRCDHLIACLVTNLITDVIFATLPVPLFIGIQVNWRTKVSLIGVLSLGYLSVDGPSSK